MCVRESKGKVDEKEKQQKNEIKQFNKMKFGWIRAKQDVYVCVITYQIIALWMSFEHDL